MDSHAAITVLCWVLVCATLQVYSADLPNFWTMAPSRSGRSVIISLTGIVYRRGHFFASLEIGSPKKAFELAVDTGSDISWIECDYEFPGFTQPPDNRYKPNNNFVRCDDPFCRAFHKTAELPCPAQDPCPYNVLYVDGDSSSGALVKDTVSLIRRDGSLLSESFIFGCGHDSRKSVAGLLGLSDSPASILSQLISRGVVTRNVQSHCLSTQDGGSLILGDDFVSSLTITSWIPFSPNSNGDYTAGPAELLRDGKTTGITDFVVFFDSGTTYTYFGPEAYDAALKKADLLGKPLEVMTEDESFPKCWKGAKPFRSLTKVEDYFKPLALSFPTSNTQLLLLPQDFLIIRKDRYVCLGILRDPEPDHEMVITIGAISMQDKLVIYDNEKKQIGWAPMDCSEPPAAGPVLKVNFTDDAGPVLS